MTRVSVAISTMERPDALSRCFDALGMGAALPAEVIVVDQSRDERTERLVANRAGDPLRIRLFRQPPRGLGASQNEAVRRSSSEVVAVTDDDCRPETDWVLRIRNTFSTPDAPDLVAGRVLALPPSGDRVEPVSLRTSTRPRSFGRGDMPWNVGSGNNFAVRRSLFLEIGGCDERLGPGSPASGGVDMDLFYRLLRAGADARYEPEIVVRHERETVSGRLARRPMYGRGMGACVGIRLREGDLHAVGMLVRWGLLRSSLAAKSLLRRGGGTGLREEALMLGGTLRGLLHGWRVGAVERKPPESE